MSKESSYTAFQKGEEFLLFLLNRGYSQKSINIAIESVTDFWKRNSGLSSNIMGHDSIETTRVYTRMTMDEQRAKINMIVDWC